MWGKMKFHEFWRVAVSEFAEQAKAKQPGQLGPIRKLGFENREARFTRQKWNRELSLDFKTER